MPAFSVEESNDCLMNPPIRILHAIGSLNQGGSQSFVMNLYRAIDRSRIQFDFVIEHPGELYYAEEIQSLGGDVIELQSFTGSNVISYRRQWQRLLGGSSRWAALHSHVRSTAALYVPIARRNGMKTIVHSHSTCESAGLKGLVKRVMELPLRRIADYHFACSEEAGRWLFGDRLFDKGDVTIVPNAIETKKYVYDEKIRSAVRRELGIGDVPIFGHVGRLSKPKNHLFLLKVFEEILKTRSDAKLVLVGDGELRQLIEDAVSEKSLDDSVLMLGHRDDANRLYQAMDVLLMPSLYEGLPVTLVESQAASLPAVITDTITKEVDIVNGLIRRVSLHSPIEKWAEASLSFLGIARANTSAHIATAGFDVAIAAGRLTDLYMKMNGSSR